MHGRNCPIWLRLGEGGVMAWQRHGHAGPQPRDLQLQIPAVVVIADGRCPFRIPALVSVRW
jgi:hypothetical protein